MQVAEYNLLLLGKKQQNGKIIGLCDNTNFNQWTGGFKVEQHNEPMARMLDRR